ncbi:hypothetical protein NLU13_2251 [Sarocladium strictum]|uniref:Uncharacterized protein n=1 Tax=Sarocladium strictum TaxID=5046 RepID=A0AA39GTB5_SARSR|nr:hypothetical protein NLU13_2251 [Sarocladium strictum]
MFGSRRRRPLLGAAVIAGTATVAARHGARRQASAEAERQFQAQQAAELRRLEEERQQARNQQAIDRAVAEALAKQQQSETSSRNEQAPVAQRSAPMGNQPYVDSPPMYAGADVYASSPSGQPMYLQPPGSARGIGPLGQQSPGTMEAGVCFCSNCGARGSVQHKFCSSCGQPMSLGTPEKQLM